MTGAEIAFVCVQSQLGVMSRAQSVSSYAVGACGQALLGCGKKALSAVTPTASQLQSQVQPYTDGIVVSSTYANALTTFAFSATSDPGRSVDDSSENVFEGKDENSSRIICFYHTV